MKIETGVQAHKPSVLYNVLGSLESAFVLVARCNLSSCTRIRDTALVVGHQDRDLGAQLG